MVIDFSQASGTQLRISGMRDFTWSKAQKEAATRAFQAASGRDCEAIRREVEAMLHSSKDARVVWRLEDYLSQRRREHDELFDYRYSVLPLVFARLLREELLSEEELSGIGEEKLREIRKVLSIR
jgi:hypothetical protein